MSHADTLIVSPGGNLRGTVEVPGDKSVSHRAVMFGALADGVTEIRDCLMGEDVIATMNAFRAMGVSIEQIRGGEIRVNGVGVDGLKNPPTPLNLGNSGTSMRLMCGLLAGAGINAEMTGDASLSSRPMRRVSDPLTKMGASIETSADGTPPLRINATRELSAIDYALPVASAQVKSAILLAALFARGKTIVREPAPTRDHTERMLGAFGVDLEVDAGNVSIEGGQRLTATSVQVPSDISSAAFFLVGAAISEDSQLVLPNIGVNPTRTGIIDILLEMNVGLTVGNRREQGGEPIADLEVRGGGLRGCEVPQRLVPLAIDEFPAIFVAAACAAGTTVVRGAEELRHKESDRIAVMATGLRSLGIELEEFSDGIAITGGKICGGEVDACDDHRIAMAFAMAALRATGPIKIRNAAAIATSFPGFVELAKAAGLGIASSA